MALPGGGTVGKAVTATLLVYLAFVAFALILRATTPPFDSIPWYELIYGPAITIASAVLLYGFFYWIAGLVGY